MRGSEAGPARFVPDDEPEAEGPSVILDGFQTVSEQAALLSNFARRSLREMKRRRRDHADGIILSTRSRRATCGTNLTRTRERRSRPSTRRSTRRTAARSGSRGDPSPAGDLPSRSRERVT